MAAACDVIYLTIVSMETNKTPRGYTYLKVQMKLVICTKFQVNRMNCVEVEEGGGARLTPPPLKASCNYFFFEALGLILFISQFCEDIIKISAPDIYIRSRWQLWTQRKSKLECLLRLKITWSEKL